MSTIEHETWCTTHWHAPADVGGPGKCENNTVLHDVTVSIAEQFDPTDDDAHRLGAPRIEVYSRRDEDALTPVQARELAALIIEKADLLEKALA